MKNTYANVLFEGQTDSTTTPVLQGFKNPKLEIKKINVLILEPGSSSKVVKIPNANLFYSNKVAYRSLKEILKIIDRTKRNQKQFREYCDFLEKLKTVLIAEYMLTKKSSVVTNSRAL